MSTYRHHARIESVDEAPANPTTGGHYDANDNWVPASTTTEPGGTRLIYEGAADLQEGDRVIQRDGAGVPTLVATATLVLPRTVNMGLFREGMVATVDRVERDRSVTRRVGRVLRTKQGGLMYLGNA